MKLQIFDCDYTVLNNKPLLRIFCKTEDGSSVCIFYDKYLPYFYLLPRKDVSVHDLVYEAEKNGLQAEIVKRILPIGYHKDPVDVLKITGRDPSKVPEIREFFRKWADPYEADVLFKYRFMVDFGLRGMSWMEAHGRPTNTNTVTCRAFDADTIVPIEALKNAPLKYLSFDIECIHKENTIPESSKDQIIMISLAFSPSYQGRENMVLVAKRKQLKDATVFDGEKEMLEKFLEIIKTYDPDILCGYNIQNFDIPYILDRLDANGLSKNIGRGDKVPFTRKFGQYQVTPVLGRVVIDPYFIIKNLSIYDQPIRFKRNDLSTVAKATLGMDKLEMNHNELIRIWKSGGLEDLQRLVEYSRRDAELALKLVITRKLVDMDKFIETAKLSGLLLQDVIGGQSARHEMALFHEVKKRNILMPPKPSINYGERSDLKGALVLEPAIGLHKDCSVLVLDFTSLYPSLIRSRNICTTTLLLKDEDVPHMTAPGNIKFVKPEVRQGGLPYVADFLFKSRAAVREQARRESDPEKRRILEAKQYALKGMTVSLWGYIGFAAARFHNPQVAAAITGWGRENLEFTKNLVEKSYPVKVIAGDTDSLFMKFNITDMEEAQKLGEEIANFVTSQLEGLQLKFEKIFKTIIILTKKRYAGWYFEKTPLGWREGIDMKGIETVRRDWCTLTSEASKTVLEIILKEGDINKALNYARGIVRDVVSGSVDVEKLVIIKGVTKMPSSYKGIQPHVEVMKKIMERDPTRRDVVGERIGYVIVKGDQLLSKRAEDPDYVKKNKLQIDPEYYIENQILPPLERIFEACGISRNEIVHGFKQHTLAGVFGNGSRKDITLKDFDGISCSSCGAMFSIPPLSGICASCKSSGLQFVHNGISGQMVSLS